MEEQTVVTKPAEPAPKVSTLVPAAMHKRYLNYLVDYYVQLFFIFILFGIAVIFFGIKIEPEGNDYSLTNILLGAAILVIYNTFFETVWGKTPGKFVSRTKVLMKNGQPAGFVTILKRSLLRLIPFEMLSLLFSKNPVGWHDKFADSVVIDEKNAQPTTKSGLHIFGLMVVIYITTAIAFIIIFGIFMFSLIAFLPTEMRAKLTSATISPTPSIQQPVIR